MKKKSTLHDRSMITNITETEDATEEGSDPGGASTTTEDPTWSPPVSRTTGTAGTAMITDHSKETNWKTSPRRRSEKGGQGSRATAIKRSVPQKNNSMDRARYTDSEMSEESSDHPT